MFLKIASVGKAYGTPEGALVRALDDVTIDVKSNEFLTLLGPSGCGKTTLLKCLAGFEDMDGGDIILEGKSLRSVPAHRRPLNTVFQNYALFPHMTIAQNIGYGLDVAGVKKPERDRRVGEALEMVGLAGFGARRPTQLSGGQQQRVALARSLILKPRILLLDEPLSALDRKMRESMQIELKNLQHTVGITFIFVTHDQEEALVMSDRIAVFDHGKLQQIGNSTEIYDTPANEFVANFVGTSNLFAGKVIERNGRLVTVETANGRRLVAASDRFAIGDSVKLVLRPEHLHIAGSDEAASDHAILGTIADTVFVGSVIRVHVDVGFGRMAILHHQYDRTGLGATLRPGTPVKIVYSPEAAHLIPAGGA
ncbi:ABC transporter ATP-binding protein [Mesorhizobium sp. GR13]|uniref:ABC transporter ATP-binding protein n=1 Tax=Mesorhizobium sp. GR13 TaxID=2562308 RepID=UPI001FEDFD98|nr:ABC transporter ATP-binding protein [Mesorhizobium sp. GR13]